MASQGHKSRITDLKWATQEAKITRLYWGEDKSLDEVMRIMERDVGFFASKSQYETRFKKWNLTKYRKRKDWNAIAAHLSHRRDAGKQTEVFWGGRSLPSSTVLRETKRHRSLSSLSSNRLIPALPPGVRLRTPPPERTVKQSDLPMKDAIPILNGQLIRSSNQMICLNPQILLVEEAATKQLTIANPAGRGLVEAQVPGLTIFTSARTNISFTSSALKALLPTSLLLSIFDEPSLEDTTGAIQKSRYVDSVYAKLLVFGLSNNFAGISQVQHSHVWEFLQTRPPVEIVQFLSCFSRKTLEGLKERFFQCAIEAGDAKGVEMFLTRLQVLVDPNQVKCLGLLHEPITAIELASAYRYRSIIALLLHHGADVNHSFKPETRKRGALTTAISSKRSPDDLFSLGEPNNREEDLPEIVALLIGAGASVDPRVVDYRNVHSQEVLLQLIEAGTPSYYIYCIKQEIFDYCFTFTDDDTALVIFQKVFQHPDMDAVLKEIHIEQPKVFEHLLERAVQYSRIKVVEFLLSRLALSIPLLGSDLLYTAVKNEDVRMARFLLQARTQKVSHGSAFIEAIKTQNKEIIDLLESNSDIREEMNEESLQSLIEASFQAGDIETASRLINWNKTLSRNIMEAGLYMTIRLGREDLAMRFIDAGADVNAGATKTPEASNSPLAAALQSRNESICHKLIDSPDIDVEDPCLLTLAVEWGDQSLVQKLLLAGATVQNITFRDEMFTTPLAMAISRNRREIISLLLKYGASVDSGDTLRRDYVLEGQTPLLAAALSNDTNLVALLLDTGANPADYRVIEHAVSSGNKAMLDLVLGRFREQFPLGKGRFGLPVMRQAVIEGNVSLAEQLLTSNINFRALSWGQEEESQEAVRSADAPASHRTPLAMAIESERETSLAIVRLMLDAGCPPDAIISRSKIVIAKSIVLVSETALLVAIGAKQLDKVRLLVDRGVDVNAKARWGIKRTPIQKAAEMGDFQTFEYLLNLGADINAPAAGRGGATALQLAASHGYAGLVELMLREGADPNAPAALADGRTALEAAAENGRLDTVKLLLSNRVSITGIHRLHFESALSLAREQRHIAVVDLLESQDPMRNQGQITEIDTGNNSEGMLTPVRPPLELTDLTVDSPAQSVPELTKEMHGRIGVLSVDGPELADEAMDDLISWMSQPEA